MENAQFKLARPVWAKGMEAEMNTTCRFQGMFDVLGQKNVVLRVAAATIYRVWLNGELVAYGPARCGHGHYRVDEWPLEATVRPGENAVVIEVAGYNVNCYAYLDQPSFLQAEIEADGMVLLRTAATGGFTGLWDHTRQQRAQRYSFQRSFTEAYVFPANPDAAYSAVLLEEQPEKKLLARGIPLPLFTTQPATALVQAGRVGQAAQPRAPFLDRATAEIGPKIKGFQPQELDAYLSNEVGGLAFLPDGAPQALPQAQTLAQDSYAMYSFSRDTTGFISLQLQVTKPCRIYLIFDERLVDGDVDYLRKGCVNIVRYRLETGVHRLMTMEPYTLKYLKVACLDGAAKLQVPAIVEYKANLPLLPSPAQGDEQLETIYAAAAETLLQNSADIFMDCPSRERAGWLCDSYFTARGERQITGQNCIERNFLENFLLPDSFVNLPEGMLPMCYPSDHYDGNFIPNWAMWLVLQLEDYQRRTGDSALVAAFQPRINGLLAYFKRFENEDGLLEDLDGWVFVDWSRANDSDLVCGVNYPSNMLYAKTLEAAAHLYGDKALAQQAGAIHERVREQSFNGTYFMDNATRQGGVLAAGETATEACQNYAFFCGTATPALYPQLWQQFQAGFDGGDAPKSSRPSPANAFIGLYVRLAALSAQGAYAQIEAEILRIFYPQAIETGTLWELLTNIASLNHGFASYAAELVAQVVAHKNGNT